jgi:DNA-binding MarR family transcriptional regulator
MPFKVNESLAYLLAQNAKRTRAQFARLMKEHQLDFGQSGWIVLSRLWEEDGLTQQEISKRACVAKPNISNYCEQLEQANYIVRVQDENDKRNYKIYLTRKGKEAQSLSCDLSQQAYKEVCAGLNDEEIEQLKQLLIKMLNG